MTCEYTRISLLVPYVWKINTFTFEHICTFFPNVYLVQFQSPLLAVAYYNSNILMVKINTHFFLSVKWLETLSLGRTVCFLQIRSLSCLMCSQLEQFQSIQIVRKALFFKLIYTPIYTRSFSRGFSLATSSYVLGGRTALIAAKLYCGLGNYSQTAIFPRMPSITDFQVC